MASSSTIAHEAPNSRCGCLNHRFRGVRENRVTIPQQELEQQLIAALAANF